MAIHRERDWVGYNEQWTDREYTKETQEAKDRLVGPNFTGEDCTGNGSFEYLSLTALTFELESG